METLEAFIDRLCERQGLADFGEVAATWKKERLERLRARVAVVGEEQAKGEFWNSRTR